MVTCKNIAEIVQGLAVGLAAVLGALWSIYLVLRHRETHPRLEIEHSVVVVRVDDQRILLRLDVILTNVGKVLVRIGAGSARLQRIAPCDEEEIAHVEKDGGTNYPERDWPEETTRGRSDWETEIEPGETEQLCFDFLLPQTIEAVSLYSEFADKEERRLRWNKTTVHLLQDHLHDAAP